MIKTFVSGNLTADPVLSEREFEVTNMETGEIIKTKAKVCNFTVAATEGYGARKTQTQFFKVSVWRGLAESCQKYLKKGKGVIVTGPVRLNQYTDKTGAIRSALEIRADEIQFLNDGKAETPAPVQEDIPW